MRDFKGMKRQRGRNRKPGGNQGNTTNPNRSWDSQGPEGIKVRGNAQTVYERYQQLARDAFSSGDRVLAENYLQHAEHYFRVLRALQPNRPVSDIAARETFNQGFDIDFEDESGAQAAAFAAAEAQRQAQGQGQSQNQGQNPSQNQHQGFGNESADGENGDSARQDGDGRDGARRETRRERWERRRAEGRPRQDRDDRDEREGSGTGRSPIEVIDPEAAARNETRGSTVADSDGPSEDAASLPGFLTRPSRAPARKPAAEASVETGDASDGDEAPKPRRRSPRKKAETSVGEDA